MNIKKQAALEGWHTLNKISPALIGTQCTECSTYYFPKQQHFCRNPNCESTSFKEVELSQSGRIWSYTSASYKPPAPYISEEPFEPFTIAAVELEKEKMIVLGQVIKGVTPDDLNIGDRVSLVLDTLHKTLDDNAQEIEKITWKWQPAK